MSKGPQRHALFLSPQGPLSHAAKRSDRHRSDAPARTNTGALPGRTTVTTETAVEFCAHVFHLSGHSLVRVASWSALQFACAGVLLWCLFCCCGWDRRRRAERSVFHPPLLLRNRGGRQCSPWAYAWETLIPSCSAAAQCPCTVPLHSSLHMCHTICGFPSPCGRESAWWMVRRPCRFRTSL